MRITHSSASTAPVEKAISGMSPVGLLVGRLAVRQAGRREPADRRVGASGDAGDDDLAPPAADLDDQRDVGARPGTLLRVNVPVTAVTALTSGEPDAVALQLSHETPGVKAAHRALGT